MQLAEIFPYKQVKVTSADVQYPCLSCRGSPVGRGWGCGTGGCGRSARQKQASCGSLETTPPSALDQFARCDRHMSCGALQVDN